MLIFVVGAVQFVNILDFMMVMPLGPDFAEALGVPASQVGVIGGTYTAAAAISGLICSFFLDRFDRKRALLWVFAGLSLGTMAGGFADSFETLLAARFLAGIFGGPATSLSFSMIADVIPPYRRGKAMGAVMGAFSVASVLGVPAGLELARLGTWRTPFFAVGGLGVAVAVLVFFVLPPFRFHLQDKQADTSPNNLLTLFQRRVVIYSYLMTAAVMMAGFIVIPNIAAYLQYNLDYPRGHLGILYMAGGVVSFVSMRLVGQLVDRYGSFRMGVVGAGILVTVLVTGFIMASPPIPVWLIFVGFMLAMSVRNVSYNTLTSKVPRPRERARFALVQSSVQHLASAIGAVWSTSLLHENSQGKLDGMTNVALVSIALSITVPILMYRVQSQLVDHEH